MAKKQRPIVAFDLETTGLDKTKDYIIEISAVKFDPKTMVIIGEYSKYVQPEGAYSISIQAYMKHHITPEFLKDKPYFFEIADEIIEFIGDCDILTYNGSSFDIPFLQAELGRCGRHIDFLNKQCWDACLEERRRNGNTLEATYQRYAGKTMEDAGLSAHEALSDVKATIFVFTKQQEKQAYGPEAMYGEDNFIVNSECNGQMQPCFNVGKYKNLPISYVSTIDQGYLNWIVEKGEFAQSTKNYVKQYIK